MRFALLLSALAVVFGFSPRASAEPIFRDLSMTVGEQTSLPAQGVKSYSEGVAGIIEVRLAREGENFVLLALRPGKTTLLLFMHDGREQHVRVQVASDGPEASRIAVEREDNVRLDLYFVQVREEYGHQLGIAYPENIGGNATLEMEFDLRGGGLGQATLGIADQILPRLDLAQRGGWAKLAHHAAVIAENGRQAQFHSGGEVNVPIRGALTAEVRSISYGSRITVEPRFDADSGRIELRVGAELANLADDGGTGVPGRHLARLDTVVNLDLGKSLVLAGLDSQSRAKSRAGLPGLSMIPILGGLFGSHARRDEHNKSLVVIVPTVVQAIDPRRRNLVDEMLRAYRDFDGEVDESALFAGEGAQ